MPTTAAFSFFSCGNASRRLHDCCRATGRVGLRIEVHDDALALELRQPHGLAVLILQREQRGLVADARAWIMPRSMPRVPQRRACSPRRVAVDAVRAAAVARARRDRRSTTTARCASPPKACPSTRLADRADRHAPTATGTLVTARPRRADRHPVLRVVLPAADAHRRPPRRPRTRSRRCGTSSTAAPEPDAAAPASSGSRTCRSRTSRPHCSPPPSAAVAVVVVRERAVRPARRPDRRLVRRVRRDAQRSRSRSRASARSSRSSRPRSPTGAAAGARSSSVSSARRSRARSRRSHRRSSSSRSRRCSNARSSSRPLIVAGIAVIEEAPEGARAYSASMLALAGGFGFSFAVVTLPFADIGDRRLANPVRRRRAHASSSRRDRPPPRRDDAVRERSPSGTDDRARARPRAPRPALRAPLRAARHHRRSSPTSSTRRRRSSMNKYLSDVRDFSNSGIALFRTVTTGVPGLIGLVHRRAARRAARAQAGRRSSRCSIATVDPDGVLPLRRHRCSGSCRRCRCSRRPPAASRSARSTPSCSPPRVRGTSNALLADRASSDRRSAS